MPGTKQKRQNRGGAHSEPDGEERVDELLQKDGGSGSVVWLPELCTSGSTAVAVVAAEVMVVVVAAAAAAILCLLLYTRTRTHTPRKLRHRTAPCTLSSPSGSHSPPPASPRAASILLESGDCEAYPASKGGTADPPPVNLLSIRGQITLVSEPRIPPLSTSPDC